MDAKKVQMTELDLVDFSKSSLPIGLKLEDGAPWLELSPAELEMLVTVLEHKMKVAGIPAETASPAELSEGLCKLRDWCLAAIRYHERGGMPVKMLRG